MLIIVSLLR